MAIDETMHRPFSHVFLLVEHTTYLSSGPLQIFFSFQATVTFPQLQICYLKYPSPMELPLSIDNLWVGKMTAEKKTWRQTLYYLSYTTRVNSVFLSECADIKQFQIGRFSVVSQSPYRYLKRNTFGNSWHWTHELLFCEWPFKHKTKAPRAIKYTTKYLYARILLS